MELTAENRRRKRSSRFLTALIGINGLFVAGVLLWWHWMSVVMSEPVRWATWQAMGPRPSIMDYPFLLLWALPLAGVAGSWFARKFGNMRMACGLAFFPVFYLGLIVGWFYLAPQTWR
jgi:hypothetical protein